MRIVYLQAAQDDLAETFDYIARDDPDAAARFVDRLRDAVRGLADQPERGSLHGDARARTRKLTVAGYRVFFRVGEDEVAIGRILHGRRDLAGLELGDDLFDP